MRLSDFTKAINAKSPVFFTHQQVLNVVAAGGIPVERVGYRYEVDPAHLDAAIAFMLALPRHPARGNGPRAGKARRMARVVAA